MSKETEKAFNQLHQFITQKLHGEIPDIDELEKLVNEFMQKYNTNLSEISEPITEKNAEDAFDYLELADQAKTKKKRKEYLEKALSLDPENIDAQFQLIKEETTTPIELLEKINPLIDKAKKQLEVSGVYRKAKGSFGLVLETRPYMRLLQNKLDCLQYCGMIGRSVRLAEEMLKLNPNDNQGIRYTLMALYAQQEDEFHARKLLQQYAGEDGSAFFLLPLSILYFKLGQWDTAEQYLNQLKEEYKITDLRKFIHAVVKKDWSVLDDPSELVYQPYEFSELQEVFAEDTYLIVGNYAYFQWAEKKLKPTRKKKK